MQPSAMPHGTLSMWYIFHFYLFGAFAIVSAILFVTRKSPVAAALWLVSTMFCLAVLYIMLDAQFIGAIQVLVYAGAIMVVFLFVIMLLNLGQGVRNDARGIGWKFMLPTALAYIVIVAGATVGLEYAGLHPANWSFALIMLGINIVLLVILFGLIDRGRLISPAYSRLDKRNLETLRRARFVRVQFESAASEGGAD